LTVSQVMSATGGIDSSDPQAAEISGSDLTVTEGICTGADECFFDSPNQVVTTPCVSFGSFE